MDTELEVKNNEGVLSILSEKDIHELLKQAMREAGYKTVVMPDGKEVPL